MTTRGLDNERGQATAFYVGILVLIFCFMSLAFDVGFLFHARRVAQNAADPAALAGAAALDGCALEGADPIALATDYANRNLQGKAFTISDVVPTPVQTTFEVDGVEFPSLSTRVERNQSFIFARFLGLTDQTVPAEAEAACVPADQLGICPFYIQSPDPNDVPSSTNPNGSFGLELNKIYRFKFGSNVRQSDGQTGGNRGFLSIFGSGGNDLTDAIENGCIGDDPDFTVSEGEVLTDTKPGNMASVWNSIADLYSYETAPQRSACNIPFDETLFIGQPYDFAVNPQLPPGTTLDQIIENCNDDPDPNDNVNGRLWPIAISDQIAGLDCGGNGRCDVELSHLAVMYIVCYPPDHGPNDCDGENPGQSALYGMFRLAEKLSLNVSGMSNNILAPRHVVLVK